MATEGQRELKKDEFIFWLRNPTTQEWRRRLLELFDHQRHLLAQPNGASADLLKGRAEVLDYVVSPEKLVDL